MLLPGNVITVDLTVTMLFCLSSRRDCGSEVLWRSPQPSLLNDGTWSHQAHVVTGVNILLCGVCGVCVCVSECFKAGCLCLALVVLEFPLASLELREPPVSAS